MLMKLESVFETFLDEQDAVNSFFPDRSVTGSIFSRSSRSRRIIRLGHRNEVVLRVQYPTVKGCRICVGSSSSSIIATAQSSTEITLWPAPSTRS